jgi:hypothetical protein
MVSITVLIEQKTRKGVLSTVSPFRGPATLFHQIELVIKSPHHGAWRSERALKRESCSDLKEEAWCREGLPFHIWLTSPALEILDVTFAMNLGWPKSREECARLIIYQSIDDLRREPIYHPTLVSDSFFHRVNVVA